MDVLTALIDPLISACAEQTISMRWVAKVLAFDLRVRGADEHLLPDAGSDDL